MEDSCEGQKLIHANLHGIHVTPDHEGHRNKEILELLVDSVENITVLNISEGKKLSLHHLKIQRHHHSSE